MSRRSTFLLILLCASLCGNGFAGEVEGVYAFGPKGGVTIRVTQGRGEGTHVGVLVRAEAEGLKATLGQPVLDLKQAADGALGGRVNACHVGLSDDPAAWLDVTSAEPLPNGDLRCTIRNASGGSAQVLYRRQPAAPRAAEDDPQDAKPGELAGAWREPDGAVTHYVSHKHRYVGLLDRLSPRLRSQGFRPGQERVRVERVEPGLYRGRMKLRNGTRERWDAVEITVQGDRLELVLGDKDKGRTTRQTAVRLGTSGGAAAALAPAAGAADPGDVTGVWRDSHGGVVRFARVADSKYQATIVRLSSRNEGYGFKVGEVGIQVTRTGQLTYEGQVLARTFGGRSSWWERIEIAVYQDTLKYTRHLRSGGTEQNAAVRMGQGAQP